MPARKATAVWHGDLKNGEGKIAFGQGRFFEPYSATSRFEDGKQTNPEELIGAAHAACFSMALAKILAEDGHPAEQIQTEAEVHLEKSGAGFAITTIHLHTEADVPDMERAEFLGHAEKAKTNCPVSKALAGCEIRLSANLLRKGV